MNINDEGFCYWICGFVDGEGCFAVSCRFRDRASLGVEIQASFSVAQKKSDTHYKLLEKIKKYFQTGSIRGDKSCYKYESRKLPDLANTVIPFFKKYPLQTEKQKSFEYFADVCSRMHKKQHLTKSGLIEIIEIIKLINPSAKRRVELERLIVFLNKSEKNQNI